MRGDLDLLVRLGREGLPGYCEVRFLAEALWRELGDDEGFVCRALEARRIRLEHEATEREVDDDEIVHTAEGDAWRRQRAITLIWRRHGLAG